MRISDWSSDVCSSDLLFADEDIKLLMGLNRGKMDDGRGRVAVYAKALKEFNALQQSVLDVAQDAGLIDPESRKLWEQEFYVPFYRVMEEAQSRSEEHTAEIQSLMSNSYAVYRLKKK